MLIKGVVHIFPRIPFDVCEISWFVNNISTTTYFFSPSIPNKFSKMLTMSLTEKNTFSQVQQAKCFTKLELQLEDKTLCANMFVSTVTC